MTTLAPIGIAYGLNPPEGPRVTFPLAVALTGGTSQTLKFIDALENGDMSFISSVFIDTTALATGTVTITPKPSGIPITVKALTQGWYAICFPQDAAEMDIVATQTGSVKLAFSNMPMPAFQWPVA